MAWLAVDRDGEECIYERKPIRVEYYGGMWICEKGSNINIRLPHGSIQKLIGRSLTWQDDPVELKGE